MELFSGGGGGACACTVRSKVAECDRLPEVPVNVTVLLPAAAPLPAVSVTLCAVPGVSESEPGEAVTPDGNPLIATATVELNPFDGAAFTEIVCPAPPAVNVAEAGETVSEKSPEAGGGPELPCTVSDSVAECDRLPDVPVNVTVALPEAAVLAAVSVKFCETPALSDRVVGLAVTP